MNRLNYKHYIIDMSSNNNFVQYNTVQGDGNNVRGVEIELIQNGIQYVIDTNDTVVAIAGTKPDTSQIFNECTITDEGYILVDITSQMSAVKGKGDYQIVLMNKDTNSQLKSFPFFIITTPSTFDVEYLVSTDEFQLMTNVIAQAKDVADKETERQANEIIRIANEEERIANEEARSNTISNAQTAAINANEAADRANEAAEACELIADLGGVIGVKGNAETDYRAGRVNITPENVGAAAKDAYMWRLSSTMFTGSEVKCQVSPLDDVLQVEIITDVMVVVNLSAGLTDDQGNALKNIYVQISLPLTIADSNIFDNCTPMRSGYFYSSADNTSDYGGYAEVSTSNGRDIYLSMAYLNGKNVTETATWKVYYRSIPI